MSSFWGFIADTAGSDKKSFLCPQSKIDTLYSKDTNQTLFVSKLLGSGLALRLEGVVVSFT